MVVLIKTLQVLLALSVLIIIHESGHFTFAKLFGIKVEKFYLFFDVGGHSLLKFRIGETEYGIGWLPLGGYCKIAGMVDESMDVESLKGEPQPWEFRTRPAWQRLLVMFGGVLFNFLLAIVICTAFIATNGESYISNEDSHIYVNELAYEMGFRNGDRILRFDDYVPESFSSLQADLGRRMVRKAVVLRGADTLDIYIDRAMIGDVLNTPGMFDLAVPFVVDSVQADSPNADAGLMQGDRLVSLNGEHFEYVQDSRPLLEGLKGREVVAEVLRGADSLSVPLQVDTSGRIGVYMKVPGLTTKTYSLLEAVPAGVSYTFTLIRDYLRDLRLVATPSTQAYKSVGSFIAIGQVFPSAWDWLQFAYILAILSVMLGVMNLIPIPGLDGGHILFTLFEMLTGRKPSDKFMMAAQMVGMLLIFALMFLAFGNDIGRLIK